MKISDTTEMMRNMEVSNRKQGNIKLIDTIFSRVDDDIYEISSQSNRNNSFNQRDGQSYWWPYERRMSNNRKDLQQGRDRQSRETCGVAVFVARKSMMMKAVIFSPEREIHRTSHHLKVVKINQKKVKRRLNKSRLNFCSSTTPCCVSDKTLTQ